MFLIVGNAAGCIPSTVAAKASKQAKRPAEPNASRRGLKARGCLSLSIGVP